MLPNRRMVESQASRSAQERGSSPEVVVRAAGAARRELERAREEPAELVAVQVERAGRAPTLPRSTANARATVSRSGTCAGGTGRVAAGMAGAAWAWAGSEPGNETASRRSIRSPALGVRRISPISSTGSRRSTARPAARWLHHGSADDIAARKRDLINFLLSIDPTTAVQDIPAGFDACPPNEL
jgi:hypothetical protein